MTQAGDHPGLQSVSITNGAFLSLCDMIKAGFYATPFRFFICLPQRANSFRVGISPCPFRISEYSNRSIKTSKPKSV
jgi:hypothetical protein